MGGGSSIGITPPDWEPHSLGSWVCTRGLVENGYHCHQSATLGGDRQSSYCVCGVPLSFDYGAFHLVFLPSPSLHLRVLHGTPTRHWLSLARSATKCNGWSLIWASSIQKQVERKV